MRTACAAPGSLPSTNPWRGHHRSSRAPWTANAVCYGLGLSQPANRNAGSRRLMAAVGQKIDAKSLQRPAGNMRQKAQVDVLSASSSSAWACSPLGLTSISTMMPRFEAGQLRAFALINATAMRTRDTSPRDWCLNCRSALAEAEVEYEDGRPRRASMRIDSRLLTLPISRSASGRRLELAFGFARYMRRQPYGHCRSANRAVAGNPQFDLMRWWNSG